MSGMPGLRAAATDLAALCTGAPCLLVLGDPEGPDPDLPGIAVWHAAPAGAGDPAALCLHRPGAAPGAETVPLPGLPAGLLGILAADPDGAAPLLAAWGDPATLPVIAGGPGALPALARLLAERLAERTAEAARQQDAMVRLREEGEETRAAMAALLGATGHDAAPAPTLALATAPSATARAVAGPEGLVLAQRPGCSLEGVAAVAVHVAAVPPAEAAAALTVRLVGAESGRVRGAWSVPAAALAQGWLVLDLPSPLGPVRETAVLEALAEPTPDGAFALSLEEAEAPPERCAALSAGTAAPGRALALRLWTAPFGRRFVLSPWWDWDAQDLPPAIPQRLPEPAWAGARMVAGRGAGVALGAADPVRPVVALDPGDPPALVALPAIPVAGLDLVEAEVAVRLGEAGALEAALWALPAGTPLTGIGDLSPALPDTRCTGWRRADAARGGLRLALRLAKGPTAPGMVTLALTLRHAAGAAGGAAPLRVAPLHAEWADLVARRLGAALPPMPPRRGDGGAAPSPGFLAAVPEAAVPRIEGGGDAVRLMELLAMPGGGYRHLDVLVEGLRLGALAWPRLRFKFAVNGEAPQIEVRARPDWPVLFERWPGTQADQHGPFFVLTEADGGGRLAGLLRTERDRRLLDALLRLLPTLIATAARAATTDPAEYDDWARSAR